MGVVFFLCLVTITPFAVGPDQALLARIGPAILWIAALLATLLGLDRLFQADAEDGSLDLFLTSETPLELIVLVKCLAHWLLTGLPLVAASPIFGLMLGLAPDGLGARRALAARRDAGADPARRDRRGADGEPAPRRAAAGGADPAAGGAGADFRRGGRGRSGRRLQDAVSDPLRPDARRRGAHALRRRGGAAARREIEAPHRLA